MSMFIPSEMQDNNEPEERKEAEVVLQNEGGSEEEETGQQPEINREPSEAPSERLFTQEEVNRIVSERLAKERARRAPASSEEVQQLQQQLTTLHQQNTELLQLVEEERRLRQEAEQKLKSLNTDKLLSEALEQAGCSDIYVAKKFLRDDIASDEKGNPVIHSPDGKVLPINPETLSQLLPDSLKKPAIRGGSGATSRSTPAVKNYRLEFAERRLEELAKRARANPTEFNIVEFQRQKRLVEDLKGGNR